MEAAYTRLKLSGCVVVKLTRGGDWLTRGFAKRGFPFMWHLSVKLIKDKEKRQTLDKDSGFGWVEMNLPSKVGRGGKVEIDHAEWIYDMIFHELGHIKDYRQGRISDDTPMVNGRRIRWKNRPIEIRAENFSYDAQQKVSKKQKEELIWGMALEIERVSNMNKKGEK
jgi:hypothetical protein